MNTNICRICLQPGSLTNIFRKSGTLMLSMKLMSLTKINVTPDDGLPKTVCSKCVKKINECFEFVDLCENSDRKLRALLNRQSDGLITTDNKNVVFKTEKFAYDAEDTLSPKSETSRVLLIDESVDNSINSVSNVEIEKESSKCNSKKTQKQQCFTCGKVMSSRFRLKTHLRTHTGERPFSCPHCSKNFSLAQNLKVHLRIHTGEKPLQCNVCGESFAQSAGLAAHRRKHTGQMPYQCVLCPRSFRTVGHLQYHTRRHTGEKNFECDTCGRAFITRSDLKQHILTHTGDRPHVCCICGLRLTRASHLKRHIQLTHSRRNIACDSCPAKFCNKNDFKKHVKKHELTKNGDEN